MTVNYYLDQKSSAVMLVIQSKGKKFRLSTHEIIKPASHWDGSNQRVKSSLKVYDDINRKLESRKAHVEKLVRDYEIIHHDEPPLNYLKEMLTGAKVKANQNDWSDLLADFVQHQKDTKAHKTYRNYIHFSNRLGEFQQDKRIDITFEDIHSTTIEDFKLYLASKKDCTHATVKLMLSQWMTILNYGVAHRYLAHFDKSMFKIKSIFNEGDMIYLTEAEITTIEKLKDLPENLANVRDTFLFQCYTGLRYSDILNFNRTNVQGGFLKVVTRKARKAVVVPLNKRAKAIIEKYLTKNGSSFKILPAYAMKRQNELLKILGKKAELDTDVELVRFVGNTRGDEIVKKWQLVCTHTGRRSFATNYILRGGKVEQLSMLMGHADIQTTQRYLRHSPEVMARIAIEFMG